MRLQRCTLDAAIGLTAALLFLGLGGFLPMGGEQPATADSYHTHKCVSTGGACAGMSQFQGDDYCNCGGSTLTQGHCTGTITIICIDWACLCQGEITAGPDFGQGCCCASGCSA
jgi:hypothetical protein